MRLFLHCRFVFVFILLSCVLILEAHASNYLKKGYIQNDAAKKCWYTQKTDENRSEERRVGKESRSRWSPYN